MEQVKRKHSGYQLHASMAVFGKFSTLFFGWKCVRRVFLLPGENGDQFGRFIWETEQNLQDAKEVCFSSSQHTLRNSCNAQRKRPIKLL